MDPFASALEQGAAVRRREVRPRELVEMYLERIERLNPRLNAYWLTTAELALAQADSAEREPADGPLHGVPVSVKDLTAIAGYPLTYGSRAFEHNVPDLDYFVVSRLKAESCPILGKTTTPEFGSRPVTEYGLHGAALNPWDLAHNAGGSSGGAAGALAAGLCAWSHGTDGGGSIRIPASCCGLVGLKPSRGRISLGPLLGEGWAGLSTQAVMARTVEDAAAGLDVLAGHLPGDPYWADEEGGYLDFGHPGTLRVGFTTAAASPVDPEVAACVQQAARAIAGLGHQVEEGGPDTAAFKEPQMTIVICGTATYAVTDLGLLDPINADAFERAKAITGADYVKAVNLVRAHSRNVVEFWDDHDVLVTPTLTSPAPRLGAFANTSTAHEEAFDWLAFTYPYNCTGQPAVSLPLGMSQAGLPIGVQLVGPPRGERLILALAAQLQDAMPWRDRRPAGFE